MAGYSDKALSAKLGIKPATRVYLEGEPPDYLERLAPLPAEIALLRRPAAGLDFVQLFVTDRRRLARRLPRLLAKLQPAGMIWVSWPKRAAGLVTDLSEDRVRELALPLGLVDVKVCAVDEVWSGLKLVIRRSARNTGPAR